MNNSFVNPDSDLKEAAPGLIRRLEVDFAAGTVTIERAGDGTWLTADTLPFDSPEAFAAISRAWLRVAWDVKYQWSFSWLGRPVIQLPEDLVRVQEVIWRLKPDVILETGVAHGGSLVFYASLCRAIGHGRVIGVEQPRSAELDHTDTILRHPLGDLITIVKGDSVDPDVVDAVYGYVDDGETVLLLLDSAHTMKHVLAELEAYTPLVTPDSYAVVQDGFPMRLVAANNGPRSEPDWAWDNPQQAAHQFVGSHPGWVIDPPTPPFDESVGLGEGVTHWTGGWIRRQWRRPGG